VNELKSSTLALSTTGEFSMISINCSEAAQGDATPSPALNPDSVNKKMPDDERLNLIGDGQAAQCVLRAKIKHSKALKRDST
jgi:hypothetical protein